MKIILTVILLLMTHSCGWSEDTPLPNVTIPAGNAKLPELKAAAEQILTSKGKVVLLPKDNSIVVQDTPENLPYVVQVLRAMTAAQPDVLVNITFVAQRSLKSFSPDLTNSQIQVTAIQDNGFSYAGMTPNGLVVLTNPQSVHVQKGATGTIDIQQVVSVPKFFQSWCSHHNYEMDEDFRWERIGTAILVKPVVSGTTITVELTPEITSYQGNIPLKELATSVVLTAGAEPVELLGFTNGDNTFNSQFYGYATGDTGFTSGTFTISAQVDTQSY